MLADFLTTKKNEILALTEEKSLELAGNHPSSVQLKKGLPIFLNQVIDVIRNSEKPSSPPQKDIKAIAEAADRGDEAAMAEAAGRHDEAELAESASRHGNEFQRLGYSLSHVVHAYGAMCQAITEVASRNQFKISTTEFHSLNRSLDVAIAGAVTGYQSLQETKEQGHDGNQTKFFVDEIRNTLTCAQVALQSIKTGTVGIGGNTGRILEQSLGKIGELLDRSQENSP